MFSSSKKVESEAKKKSRKIAKFQRAVTGATLEDIMKKRNQKPEVRKAQREQAIRAAKDLKKAKAQQKKPAAAAPKVISFIFISIPSPSLNDLSRLFRLKHQLNNKYQKRLKRQKLLEKLVV